jgi:hypothetical protein
LQAHGAIGGAGRVDARIVRRAGHVVGAATANGDTLKSKN